MRTCIITISVGIIIGSGCKTIQKVRHTDYAMDLPMIEVRPENKTYRGSVTKRHDILHMNLDVSFDWENTWVEGRALLTIKPYANPTQELILDAYNFQIQGIKIKDEEPEYTYDEKKLTIKLDKEYTEKDTFKVEISYIARPNMQSESDESAAIKSDKGLFFINPDGSEKNKPRQIWTQGETQFSSHWFPTIDIPNEKMTQQINITVEDSLITLSNGNLIYSKYNEDGTRTDSWKQDKPHAPYLTMLVIGNFSVVKDEWKGKQVYYYVEEAYKPYAQAIFGNTPEMMSYYSTLLGIEYPWEKYAQVVVRDYVSGAMENTSAVIHGEFMQQTQRELLDKNYEDVIAHEMFHHWFGDLVTCESWSNLAINESFATYGEYLWNEYKYGRAVAQWKLYKHHQKYLQEASYKKEPIVRYYYNNPIELFDAHNYSKGGSVLHMLRNYLGDAVFFRGLNTFLTKYAYQSVEVHQLRLIFEEVSGEDLNWFFDQWFYRPGHPEINMKYSYNEASKKLSVEINQTQLEHLYPVYQIPTKLDIYYKDTIITEEITLKARKETFNISVLEKPQLVILDPENVLVKELKSDLDQAEWLTQYYRGKNIIKRYESILHFLNETKQSEELIRLWEDALKDDFEEIRKLALRKINMQKEENVNQVVNLIKKDTLSSIRAEAILALNRTDNPKQYLPIIKQSLGDSSYLVVSTAINFFTVVDTSIIQPRLKELEKENNTKIVLALANLYSQKGKKEDNTYFLSKFQTCDDKLQSLLLNNYGEYLGQTKDTNTIIQGIRFIAKKREQLEASMGRKLYLSSIKQLYNKNLTEKNEIQKAVRKSKNLSVEEKEQQEKKLAFVTRVCTEIEKEIGKDQLF